jgi:glycosyltransferase involved in cell wall biosynthesis
LAIVQAELFPFLPGGIEARLLRIPYIYDFDDAFFLKYRQERFRRVSFLLKDKFEPVISRAAAVLAGNRYLADYAKQLNPATTCLPTVVDTDRYVHLSGKREDIFTIGWIGSPSTSVYLSALAPPLAQLGREGPVRFVVVGGRCEAIDGVEVVNLPWEEAAEVGLINTFDVGVMPLFEDEWARGKCAFKLIQYMACGVPVVASPVGANVDVVGSDCGLLAKDDGDWALALRRLRDDVGLRKDMGLAGRERVVKNYSLSVGLPIMAQAIKSVASSE